MVLRRVLSCWLILIPTGATLQGADPIQALDTEYVRSSMASRNLSREERALNMERWLIRFREVARNNPDSPYTDLAEGRIVALLNSLGRTAESIAMLERHLAQASSDLDRARILYEIGETAWLPASARRDEALARKAFDSYTRAREFLGESKFASVIATVRCASLEATVFGRHGESADLYERALDRLRSLPAEQQPMPGDWVNSEHLLQGIAVENARAGRAEKSIKAARELEELDQREHPMTLHLSVILGGFPDEIGRPLEVCEHVGNWIARRQRTHGITARADVPAEARFEVAQLTYRLALAHRVRGDAEREAFWLENLMASAEDAAFREENRNLIDMAQGNLRHLYLRTGRPDLIAALDERVKQWPRAATP